MNNNTATDINTTAANLAAEAANLAAAACTARDPYDYLCILQEEAAAAVKRIADHHPSDRNMALAEVAVSAIDKMSL